ncbi:uncharacterized protein LOC117300189 [Asterias rubens]|uniref:uncharacterized protein LOC117300189 n=1 Tax=Asterias rubens TaxID=7604 RepID=UPI0014552EEA|nr:uncharacterized protein LOC117300189 [Asterias rubens]
MLLVDQSASLPYYAPCLDDDFHCEGRNLCIKRYLLCDGIRQCGVDNLSDERDCNYDSGTCTADFFRCSESGSSMGLCIPKRKKCDRKRDCYKGEDEDDCTCKGSEFKCARRGGCIRKSLVCDDKTHCLDGSDEMHCGAANMHECPAEKRNIPKGFVCDDYKDCIDGSDEANCPDSTNDEVVSDFTCESSQYTQCGDIQQCYNLAYECDGENDCTNGHDESLEVCGREAVCDPPQAPCPLGGGCGVLCNLRDECVQLSDETNCICSVFMNSTDETPVEIVKCSGISRSLPFSFAAVESGYWITCDSSGTSPRIRTSLYECDGELDCYRPGSSIPQPCKTVSSGCYLSPYGDDYKGNSSVRGCLPWSHPNVTSEGYNGLQYWELEGLEPGSTVTHNYCRNPSGLQYRPWCFVQNHGMIEANDSCIVERPYSPVFTCHNVNLNISIALEENDRSNASQGRLQLTTAEGVVGTISDQFWTIDDKNVICSQLGFPAGALWDEFYDFGPGTGPVLITDVRCTGFENLLVDCFYRVATGNEDDHRHDVGVVCNTMGYFDRPNISNVDDRQRVRRDTDWVSEAADISIITPLIPNLQFDPPTQMRKVNRKRNLATDRVYSCGDGKEIPYWQTCNKFPDCADGRDEWAEEMQCDDIVTECNLYEFQCEETDSARGRKCIHKTKVCDGYNDCTNNQKVTETNPPAWDEQRCPQFDETEPPGYHRCYGSSGKAGHFIQKRKLCNTVRDCVEGDDETECLTDKPKDKEDPFADPNWYLPYKSLLKPKFYPMFESFPRNYTKPPFDRVADLDPPNWDSFMTFSARPDYSDLVDVLELSGDQVANFGHQKEDFILQCTYEQKKCNMSLIKVIQNDKYGNCFTFNNKDQQMRASKTGSRNGLQMTLFLEQSEYISIYGQEAGVRVSITPTHISPSPTDIGITIKPGTVTSIGLRYNDVIRKGPPHGDCMETVANTLIIANGTIRKTTSEKYDRGLCKKACVHKNIWEQCGCSDTLELDGQRCRLLNDTQDLCKNLVYFVYHHDMLKCNCPEQCSDIYYTKTSSMSVWPSRKFAKLLLRNIHSINDKTKVLNEDNIYENIARLEIYYEELNYERTEETPSYQESSLFGDIGGIVGLYIGFSLITVCEFIGLFLKLIKNNCLAPATSL